MTVLRFWTIRRSDEVRVEFSDGHQTVLHPRELDERLLEDQFEGTDESLEAALEECHAAEERSAA